MLWFCIHFPQLALNVYGDRHPATDPCVVYHAHGNRQYIAASNQAAQELGIYPGMTLGSASNLCRNLITLERNLNDEIQLLQDLACWGLQYSSEISLSEPNCLLIEIAGSLQLFGGLDALSRKITQDLQQQNYFFQYGIAPTPAAAELLAKAGDNGGISTLVELTTKLKPLPLSCFDIELEQVESLRGIGLRTIGDVLKLQRSSINRRLGAAFGIYLEKLFGQRADIRPRYTPPSVFNQAVELPVPVDNADALLFVAKRLLNSLHGFLRAHGSGTQQLQWVLQQNEQCTQTIVIGLASLQRDPNHLYQLVKERFNQTALTAPVHTLRLLVEQHFPLEHQAQSLFPQEEKKDNEEWQRLFERLRARLDDSAIQQLSVYADHRPERALNLVSPLAIQRDRYEQPTLPQDYHYRKRPLWLLPSPSPLPMRNQQPYYYGSLTLISGPERIESGWWDHCDVQRDYYVAKNPKGVLVWVFRSLDSSGGWFLHGIF